MRVIALIGFSVVCCIVLGGCSGDTSSKDLAALNGDWAFVAIENHGEVATPNEIKGQRWSINGNMITAIMSGVADHKMAFKLDADKTPKEMDILPQYDPYEGKSSRAIYTLESGKLRVCVADPDEKSARPTEFSEAMVLEKIVR
jgi:uncharacterized protein (TIGR03067 family)